MDTQAMFIRTEELRHSILCLDEEISHLRRMALLYRQMELMDEHNSWVNGFGPWRKLMIIMGFDEEKKLKSDLMELNDTIKRKEQMWIQLIKEVENECSSDSNETKH